MSIYCYGWTRQSFAQIRYALEARYLRVDVIPNAVLRIRCDPNWRLDSNWARALDDYDLWYVWAGRGEMVTSDGRGP